MSDRLRELWRETLSDQPEILRWLEALEADAKARESWLLTPSPRDAALSAATEASQEAHEREAERRLAAWITGSAYHAREADRARAWAEFHALACRGRR